MIKDIVRAMIKALPDVKEDGNSLLLDGNWEVTLHAGRATGGMQIQQITRLTLETDFVVIETHKGQRVVMLLDEVRGFAAEPSTTDRKSGGRKTGFV